ncbi:glycosyltransferase [Amylibacter sp.]|nr:glycosyltransferase [Amylibacter sp.]
MKNILFVITKSEVGGAQKWVKEQISICNQNFNSHLATNKRGWLTKNFNSHNLFISKLIEMRFSITYLFLLNKYVSKNKIDMIIASSANAGIVSRLLKILNKDIKVIYVSHGWSAIYNGNKITQFFYTQVEKYLSKLSDSILCISEYDYNTAINIIGINKEKLKWISNSIYPIQQKNHQILEKKIRILSVARLSPPKRMDLLINAVQNIPVDLHIIGDGVLKSDLEKTSQKNVIFHGEIEGFKNFSEYDVFCLISDSEGLPLSAIEAMSCGLPLIISEVGGCSELISGNGSLVRNNISDINKKILECLPHIEKYGLVSKELFEAKFNLKKNKQIFISFYEEIL